MTPPAIEFKSLSTNNNPASPLHTRRSWASWQPALLRSVLLVGLVLATVLITQFFSTSSADAARAAALAVWAHDDPARVQAAQRFAACMRDEVPGVVEASGCARHAGGAALGEAMVGVTEAALQSAMEHIPAPLAWVMH